MAIGWAIQCVVVADLGVGARAGGGVDGVGAPEDADCVAVCPFDWEVDAVDVFEALPDVLYREKGERSAYFSPIRGYLYVAVRPNLR